MPTDDNYWNQPFADAQTGQQAPAAVPQTGQPGPERPSSTQQQQAHQQYQQQAQAYQPFVQPQPQFYAAAPAQQKKQYGWIVAIVMIVCLFLFTGFCVKSCTDAVGTLPSVGGGSGVSISNLDEDAVAVIDIAGTIQYDGTECSPEGFKSLLDEASDNSHVKALVLRVNSGGGTATAGEEMAEYLKEFDKPVVVSSASINASAAYEISAQADYIYVAKSTEIGAIGTAMQLTDLSGLLDMLGINMEVITSADSKDSSYGYRALTDEERAYYQKMVNQINEMFIENVAEGRNMSIDDVRKLATGLAFTGVDAVDNGLADKVGTREDAIEKAAELAGISSYTVCDLYLSSNSLEALYDIFGSSRSSTDILLDIAKDGASSAHLR